MSGDKIALVPQMIPTAPTTTRPVMAQKGHVL
jgi:hypothetical protein